MKHTKLFFALCSAAMLFAACDKNEPNDGSNNNDPKNDTKEAVDLGLSVKWATCNVGATSPEKYGNYYAWGETTTKSNYSWNTYKYGTYKYDGNNSKLTKYTTSDGKTTLDAADDAATVNWGSEWRMPTSAEWEELINNCDWTWTTKNGVKGCEVKSKTNSNSIFLPAAGVRDNDLENTSDYGYYWSSSLYTSDPHNACYALFYLGNFIKSGNSRFCGLSVRPVLK